MTIAKHRALLALLLCFTLLLCSCKIDTTGLTPLHALENGEHEETRPPASEYDYVILPASAGDALTARAHALCEALTAQTGIPATLFFDDAILPTRENIRFILLGNTAHALSYKHLHTLRRDDYLCTTDESALILGGKSDAATVAAIDRFCESLLPYADATILINPDQHFLVHATYDVNEISLNGFPLADYRLVYPEENGKGEQAVALALREAIADRCGFYLEVLPDTVVREPARVITVGACFGTSGTDAAQFEAISSYVSLDGDSEYALASVAQAFCRYLLPDGTHDSLSVTLGTPIAVPLGAPSLSVFAGLLSMPDSLTNVLEMAHLVTAFRSTDTLLAPCGRMSLDTFTYLRANLPDYAVRSLSPDPDHHLPVFYREDTLTLLEHSIVNDLHVLRFAIRETAQTFTVCHGYADAPSAVDRLWQTVSQALRENELCFLFAVTPNTLPFPIAEGMPFDEIGTSERAEQMHVLLYRPSAFASTVAISPEGADAPYRFIFTHPFLRK